MSREIHEAGEKWLAVLGCTVMFVFIIGGSALTFAFWFFKRGLLLLILSAGCSEWRVSADCKTLVYSVSFCSEVIR